MRPLPAAQIFTFMFLMLGPFKIVGPYAAIIRGADPGQARRIALLATLYAGLALLVAAFLGESVLRNFGIPLPVLALSAGIILFLVALLNILQQFQPPGSPRDHAAPGPPELKLALIPLAFPAIVTPYGIAALIVFLSLSQDVDTRLTVGAIVVLIMLLNLAVMLLTRYILPVLNVVMPIVGAVLGVVQVALGLQIIHRALLAMGVL
jgi:multiple antibiotic resistance protein